MLRQFQFRYGFTMVGAILLTVLFTMGASLYLIHRNYDLFMRIAVKQAPVLIESLEREQNTMVWFIGVSVSVILFGFLWFALGAARRLIFPVLLIENHLRALTRGDFAQPPVRVRGNDEFQEFVEAYNYFYSSLQVQFKKDLLRLRQLPVEARHQEATRILDEMVEEKRRQISEPSVSISIVPGRRRGA
jgi:hypothetical protein